MRMQYLNVGYCSSVPRLQVDYCGLHWVKMDEPQICKGIKMESVASNAPHKMEFLRILSRVSTDPIRQADAAA